MRAISGLKVVPARPVLQVTLPGARLTSARLLPAESWFSSRQWPVDSFGSQMAAAAPGASLIKMYFYLTFLVFTFPTKNLVIKEAEVFGNSVVNNKPEVSFGSAADRRSDTFHSSLMDASWTFLRIKPFKLNKNSTPE